MPQQTLRPDPFRDTTSLDMRGDTPRPKSTHPIANATAAPAWTVRRRQTAAAEIARRSYEILWQASNGDIMDARTTAPALPEFEAAFNAFARGAIFTTDNGPVAIEDLLPGDRVETVTGEMQTVLWIGSMELRRNDSPDGTPEPLVRLTPDALGFGQPSPDLLLGSGARYLLRSEALKSYLGTSHALASVTALIDGVSTFEVTPPSRVRTYHICLERHSVVRVNGVECETFHPGLTANTRLSGGLRDAFMDLFPHLNDLGGFGAMAHPRLTPTDLIQLELV
ncbi:Hint domain-containing protein [Celeribacter sp.]|uniref:Hint domain-containing protein n=1 Tax=Celeribacter sp. TaxID=1890673 RepID=UPI003A954E9E